MKNWRIVKVATTQAQRKLFFNLRKSKPSLAWLSLDDRSRAIVVSRWPTDEKKTLHELADEYGVSAERMRQIEAAAIRKLQTAMATIARRHTRT